MSIARWFSFLLPASVGLLLGAASVKSADSDFSLAPTFPPADLVTADLVANVTAIEPGKPFTAGLRFKMKKGWHIYWQYAGDFGFPPSVEWTLPDGFTAGPIQWPIPESKTEAGDILTYLYEGEVLLPVLITPPAQIPATVNLHGKLHWLVCEKTCIPGDGEVNLSLPGTGEAQPANSDLFNSWAAKLPKEGSPPFPVKWDLPKKGEISVTLTVAAADITPAVYFIPPDGIKPSHPQTGGPAVNGEWTSTVTYSDDPSTAAWRALLVLEKKDGERTAWYTASDSTQASGAQSPANASPKDSGGSPGIAANASGGSASPTAGSGNQTAMSVAKPRAVGAEKGFFAMLLAAFLGGLILNVMPCVLPVIALKIFGFIKQAGNDPKQIFRLGLTFVAGVYTFFLGLAVLVLVLHATGNEYNWGLQFQNPYVFSALIALVFIFGLNMLGVFEITLAGSAMNTLGALSRKEGYSGAFLHGMFTTLLGTSCTAPFLSASLGYATTQSPVIIITIFLAIATGMSLPYLLLTAKPDWMKFLPKPGDWMDRAKQFMGFLLLAVAAWLLGIFVISRPEASAGLIHYLLVIALACWIYGSVKERAFAIILAVILVAGGYVICLERPLRAAPRSAAVSNDPDGTAWQPFSESKINAGIAQNRPVFIDFTAEWCINCKAYEHAVLKTSPVEKAFRDKKVETYKADWTSGDQTITRWLKKFGRVGVPLYILYRPGETEPVVLDALTPDLLLGELSKIKT